VKRMKTWLRIGMFSTVFIVGMAAILPAQAASRSASAATSGRGELVKINAATGAIISVKPITRPLITVHDVCDSGWACWVSGNPIYASIGFNGTAGTATGNWLDRAAFFTGNYTARFKYTYLGAGHSGGPFGPNVTVYFYDNHGHRTEVTGTSATIN
jgi:hypothetical protein